MKKLVLIASLFLSVCAYGQNDDEKTVLSAALTTEGQWNTNNGQANWVNLLDVGLEQKLWKGATFHGSVLAAYNLRADNGRSWSVADDLQGFSNILLDDQLPLSLFQFSIDQQITDNFMLSFGVRNLNTDFFCSPMTALFTGSSSGIYPTVAANWNVGNYPASALTLFWQWELAKNFYWKNAFQNGQASTSIDESFRFRPGRDGIVNVTELSYIAPEDNESLLGEYHLGAIYGNRNAEAVKDDNFALYGLIEQPLLKGDRTLGLLLQGSYASKNNSAAYCYWGAGAVAGNLFVEGDNFGVLVNRALYTEDGRETAVELTYSVPVTKHISIQPAFTFIRTNGESNNVAVLRAVFEY